jgi:hypothetical protein
VFMKPDVTPGDDLEVSRACYDPARG